MGLCFAKAERSIALKGAIDTLSRRTQLFFYGGRAQIINLLGIAPLGTLE